MNQRRTEVASTADREIVTERLIDAPREQVFSAWTDADHLSRWWGARGARTTILEFDLRPGGTWRFVMHGADGTNYRHENVFVEIVPNERIVFQHVSAPLYHVTATFADEAGKTRLTWRMSFASAIECERAKRFAVEGNIQHLDRLEAELPSMA